jgi:hypothetical protein
MFGTNACNAIEYYRRMNFTMRYFFLSEDLAMYRRRQSCVVESKNLEMDYFRVAGSPILGTAEIYGNVRGVSNSTVGGAPPTTRKRAASSAMRCDIEKMKTEYASSILTAVGPRHQRTPHKELFGHYLHLQMRCTTAQE